MIVPTFVRRFAVVTFAAGLAGCSQTPENLFVLLESPDSSPASIEVQTAAGSQVLDQPGQASGFDQPGQAPIAPINLSAEEVQRVFGQALAAAPPEPKRFMLYFRAGGAQLTDESEALLPEVFAATEAAVAPSVDVVGHTDRVGGANANARLALRRATYVQELLIDRGLDPKLIQLDSHGENNPLVPTDDGVDEPKNRRVEITVR